MSVTVLAVSCRQSILPSQRACYNLSMCHLMPGILSLLITQLPRTPKGNNAIAVLLSKLTKYVYVEYVYCTSSSD